MSVGTTFRSISYGSWHTCAITTSGTAKCWGDNSYGQLGNGSRTPSSTPVIVKALTLVAGIATGAAHSCALLANGTAKCWGYNWSGQLGNGTTTDASTAVVVSGI